MEGSPPPALIFAGRSSTLIATDAAPARGLDELGKVQQAFAAAATWSDVSSLARQGRRLARDAGRLAECYELMEEWHAEAEECGDRAAIDEAAREMVWILEAWGRTELAVRLDYHRASLATSRCRCRSESERTLEPDVCRVARPPPLLSSLQERVR